MDEQNKFKAMYVRQMSAYFSGYGAVVEPAASEILRFLFLDVQHRQVEYGEMFWSLTRFNINN